MSAPALTPACAEPLVSKTACAKPVAGAAVLRAHMNAADLWQPIYMGIIGVKAALREHADRVAIAARDVAHAVMR